MGDFASTGAPDASWMVVGALLPPWLPIYLILPSEISERPSGVTASSWSGLLKGFRQKDIVSAIESGETVADNALLYLLVENSRSSTNGV
jgi:hypothetical protein